MIVMSAALWLYQSFDASQRCELNIEFEFLFLLLLQNNFPWTLPLRNPYSTFLQHNSSLLTKLWPAKIRQHWNESTWFHQVEIKCFPLLAYTSAVVEACPFPFFSMFYLCLPNTGSYPKDTGPRCHDLTLIGANSCLHIPPSYLYCMQQNSGLRGEKSSAWICSLNFTLSVWICLLEFECKLFCERSQRHDWNIGAAGHISNVAPLKAKLHSPNSNRLWYQMKVKEISAKKEQKKKQPKTQTKTKQRNKKPKTKTTAGTKRSFSCRQVAEVWLVASVWQCELTVSLTDISDPASSARTALLAPLVCLICSVCWASSNLAASNGATGALSVSSPLDCQKSSVRSPLLAGPSGSKKINQTGEGLTLAGTFFHFMLRQHYSYQNHSL